MVEEVEVERERKLKKLGRILVTSSSSSFSPTSLSAPAPCAPPVVSPPHPSAMIRDTAVARPARGARGTAPCPAGAAAAAADLQARRGSGFFVRHGVTPRVEV